MILAWLLVVLAVSVVVTTVLSARGSIGPNRFFAIGPAVVRRDEATWRRAHRAAVRVIVPGLGTVAIVGVHIVGGAFGEWSRVATSLAILTVSLLLWAGAGVAERTARAGAPVGSSRA